MRAFVTGATGFVGAALVRELLVDRVEVCALVRPNADLRNLAGLEITTAIGDVRDASSLIPAMNGCDWVFHVAAHYGTKESDADLMYAVNVQGTQNLLQAARSVGVVRFVHCSTVGTIGRTSDGSLPTEDTPFNLWQTASHYARSKYQGECAALDAAASGLPVVVVNPCAPVGMRDIKPSSSGQRILDALNGKLPSFLDGGINHIAVEDVARGHILAAQCGRAGQRYILGNRNLTLRNFLDLVEHASGVPVVRPRSGLNPLALLRRRQPQAGETRPAALVCDCRKAINELGLPQTSLEMAFYQAVRWFRDNGYLGRESSRLT